MGYVFLVVALFAGASKGFCAKKSSAFVKSAKDSAKINLIRMLLCILIGFFFMLFDTKGIKFSNQMLLISVVSGITTSFFLILWMMSVRQSAFMLVDVFLMVGVIVPTTLTAVIFHEQIHFTKFIGIGILIIATLIMCSYNTSLKGKMTVMQFVLLLFSGIFSGLADFSQKWFTTTCEGQSVASFNFYSYIVTAVVLAVYVLFSEIRDRRKLTGEELEGEKTNFFNKVLLIYIFFMAVCLFLNSYFKTLASAKLPASTLYPVSQGGGLILSTIMSAVFFKEKPSAKSIIGAIVAFVGLIVINFMTLFGGLL